MDNNKRQPNSLEDLVYEQQVKPEVNKQRADLSVTLQNTEQPMFKDEVMEEICSRNNLETAYYEYRIFQRYRTC